MMIHYLRPSLVRGIPLIFTSTVREPPMSLSRPSEQHDTEWEIASANMDHLVGQAAVEPVNLHSRSSALMPCFANQSFIAWAALSYLCSQPTSLAICFANLDSRLRALPIDHHLLDPEAVEMAVAPKLISKPSLTIAEVVNIPRFERIWAYSHRTELSGQCIGHVLHIHANSAVAEGHELQERVGLGLVDADKRAKPTDVILAFVTIVPEDGVVRLSAWRGVAMFVVMSSIDLDVLLGKLGMEIGSVAGWVMY